MDASSDSDNEAKKPIKPVKLARPRAVSEPPLLPSHKTPVIPRGETTATLKVLREVRELLALILHELEEFSECHNLCLAIQALRGGENAETWLLYTYITSHRLKMRSDPKFMALDNLPVWNNEKARYIINFNEHESACFSGMLSAWQINKNLERLFEPVSTEILHLPNVWLAGGAACAAIDEKIQWNFFSTKYEPHIDTDLDLFVLVEGRNGQLANRPLILQERSWDSIDVILDQIAHFGPTIFVRHGILEVIFPPSTQARPMQIIPFRCADSISSPAETLQNFDMSISRAAIKLHRREPFTHYCQHKDLAIWLTRSCRYSLSSRRCVVIKDTAIRPERIAKATKKGFACPVPLAQRERRSYPNILAGMSEIIKQNMNRIDELEPNTVFFDSSRTGRQAAVKSLKKQVYKYDNNGYWLDYSDTEKVGSKWLTNERILSLERNAHGHLGMRIPAFAKKQHKCLYSMPRTFVVHIEDVGTRKEYKIMRLAQFCEQFNLLDYEVTCLLQTCPKGTSFEESPYIGDLAGLYKVPKPISDAGAA